MKVKYSLSVFNKNSFSQTNGCFSVCTKKTVKKMTISLKTLKITTVIFLFVSPSSSFIQSKDNLLVDLPRDFAGKKIISSFFKILSNSQLISFF